MAELTPVTRKEIYLAAAGGQEIATPEPVTRLELFLAKLAGMDVEVPEPVTRVEYFLAAACGMEVEKPIPVTRLEMLLDNMSGGENDIPPVTRLEMFLAEIKGGEQPVLLTYTGNLPATITAVAHAIASLTRYGLCTQDGTPTPDAPVDIMTNNGAIKVRRPSGMPIAYQMVEWLKPSGTIIITGFKTKSTQEIETVFYREWSGACYLYSSDTATGGTTNTTAYLTSGAGNWRWDGRLASINVPTATQVTSIQNENGVLLNGLRYGVYSDAGDFVSTNDLRLSAYENTTVRFYSMTIREGETVTLDLVPVQRVTDNAYGFYDKVSGNFYANPDATFEAGDPIPDPVEIYCGGTHPGKNLVDLTAVTDGYYYDPSGVYAATVDARLSDFIPVKAGQKYTAYVANLGSEFAFNVRANLFSTDRVWLSQSATPVNQPSVIVITPTEDGYLRLSANYKGSSSTSAWADWSKLQIVRGEYTLATMPPYEPYTEIPYQPEVLTISGINLLDPSTSNIIIGEIINEQGQSVTVTNNWRTDYIPVVGGETYIFYGRRKSDDVISAYCRINFYTADKTAITPRPSYKQNTPTVATAPSNAAYVRLSSAPYNSSAAITMETFNEFNWMFAEAAQEIPYQPYVTPQTASVPMLLGVGDYKDAAELISGIKTGKVGVKVLDGGADESWGYSQTSGADRMNLALSDMLPANYGSGLCTHLKRVSSVTEGIRFGASNSALYVYLNPTRGFNSAALWKAFLAAQYAAGTPVIVLYPLATETTEQTTAQHLVTHNGVNVVDSTANVSPVEVEIEYYGTEEEGNRSVPMLGMRSVPTDDPDQPEERTEPAEETEPDMDALEPEEEPEEPAPAPEER